VISNPDMLHTGILPTTARVLRNLRFIVIDEMHVYRVFGRMSPMSFAASAPRVEWRHPQFILTRYHCQSR
jgi:hypothetical protein